MKLRRFWSWVWIVVGGLYFIIPLVATFLFSLQAKKERAQSSRIPACLQ